jgi:hypothetical protein
VAGRGLRQSWGTVSDVQDRGRTWVRGFSRGFQHGGFHTAGGFHGGFQVRPRRRISGPSPAADFTRPVDFRPVPDFPEAFPGAVNPQIEPQRHLQSSRECVRSCDCANQQSDLVASLCLLGPIAPAEYRPARLLHARVAVLMRRLDSSNIAPPLLGTPAALLWMGRMK